MAGRTESLALAILNALLLRQAVGLRATRRPASSRQNPVGRGVGEATDGCVSTPYYKHASFMGQAGNLPSLVGPTRRQRIGDAVNKALLHHAASNRSSMRNELGRPLSSGPRVVSQGVDVLESDGVYRTGNHFVVGNSDRGEREGHDAEVREGVHDCRDLGFSTLWRILG